MKKKRFVKSDAAQADAYSVGQVSGSLFPWKHKSSPGALTSLFSTPSADTLVFVPAAKTEAQSTPAKTHTHADKKSDNQVQKQKKIPKVLSTAERKLEERESALQHADDEGQKTAKKVKRKRPAVDDEPEGENHQVKRKMMLKNMAEERVKMKRTVFVGNLPPSCTKKNLLTLFKEAGAIETVRFRSVVREDPTMSRRVATIQRKVHPRKQSINAYIVFRDEEAAAGALKWNGREFQGGFHIRVDRVSQHNEHDHKRSIFVGNLPYDITDLSLRQHFEECGRVEGVRLVRDRDSGLGKGFGYVLFETSDSVMLALKLDGSQLLDRKIRVKRSVKKEKEKKKNPQGERSAGRPASGPNRRDNRPRARGFKGQKQEERNKTGRKNFRKNPGRNQSNASFKGEMADPAAKRGKGLKKKLKSKKKTKTVNI